MRIRYRANMPKALEVVLWFADREPEIDFYKILKLLYYAEKYHLNKYGRPIVGGDYEANRYRPVSLPVYDILREEPLTVEMLDRNAHLPFNVVGKYRVTALRSANHRLLSKSDVEALEEAHRRFGDLGFADLTELSHEEPAWRKADGGTMSYEDFLDDTPDKEARVRDLAEVSRHTLV